jgi:proline iminopeptidase
MDIKCHLGTIYKIMKVLKLVSLICLIAGSLLSACSKQNGTIISEPIINEPIINEVTVQADDVTLHVRIAGNQEAEEILIAIHGGPGNSMDYMVSLEELASDEIAVITYDQRGAGRSSEPSEGFALLKYVEDLEAVRKAVGSEKVHLFGHSWGGIVAMRYATIYPQRVKSIILMGSGPPSAAAANAAQANLRHRIAALQQQGVIGKELPSTSEELLLAILPAFFSDASFEMPDELANMSFNQEASNQTYAALGEWDFKAEVSQLRHSILLLWGEDDPFGISMAEATKTALVFGDVDFVVLNACGHFWQECPQEFFSQVRSFIGQGSSIP